GPRSFLGLAWEPQQDIGFPHHPESSRYRRKRALTARCHRHSKEHPEAASIDLSQSPSCRQIPRGLRRTAIHYCDESCVRVTKVNLNENPRISVLHKGGVASTPELTPLPQWSLI
ncbi:hypothetical protein CH063_04715, partial [Colletotrichum higginsianum]